MKVKHVNYEKPKSREKALNLAVHMLQQKDNRNQRRNNLMENRNSAEAKIERLTETLANINSQLETINKMDSDWERRLAELKLDYNLTESEILSLKSELTRKKIAILRRDINMEVQAETLE